MAIWKSTKLTLVYPIAFDGKDVTELTIGEPDVDAVEVIEEAGFKVGEPPTVAQLRAVIGALAHVPNELIGKLHRSDFQNAVEVATPLLEASLAPSGEPTATSAPAT